MCVYIYTHNVYIYIYICIYIYIYIYIKKCRRRGAPPSRRGRAPAAGRGPYRKISKGIYVSIYTLYIHICI